MSTKPIRGQRRRGTPSLMLPGDPDDCGQTAHVWPPDLHGWLISLAPPRWST